MPNGPFEERETSAAPHVAFSDFLSVLPSLNRIATTELRVLALLAGNAPDMKLTSRIKSALIIPTGPPDAP